MSNTSDTPASHLPWYRTRKFWLVVIGLQILVSFLILLQPALDQNVNFDFINAFTSSTGILVFVYLMNVFTNTLLFDYTNLALIALYSLTVLVLLYKTFIKDRVNIVYPMIYLSLAVMSTTIVLSMMLF